MLAVVLNGSFENSCITVDDVATPKDEPKRLVIEVVSAGITKTEARWITNWQDADGKPRTQPVRLGLEFAGRVLSLGPNVRGSAVGQNVMGMLDPYRAGAMATFVSAEEDYALPMPAGLSYDAASTLPLSGQTAWQALIRYGKLERGQRVLIHGGAGAVGTFAIQIASWIGAYVVVTSSTTDENLCRSLGANEVVDYGRERFEDLGGDYDLVFDQIGGKVQERSWAVLKRGGRLVTIAGEEKDAPDPERARAAGITALFFIVDRNNDELRRLTDLTVSGIVRPVIGKRFQLASATKAFSDHSDRFAGKAVLLCA